MALKPFQAEIIRQLISQEKMLCELYGIFAAQFPEYKAFWEKLSTEEERHATLLQKLYDAAKKGQVFFDEGKTTLATLNLFLTRLEDILQKARHAEFTLPTALACAADYETSLIEKNAFTHFDSLSEKVKATLKTLHTETLSHVERVRKEQKAIRQE